MASQARKLWRFLTTTGTPRELPRLWRLAVYAIGVLFVAYEVWALAFVALDPLIHRAVFLSFGFLLTFLVYGPSGHNTSQKITLYDLALAGASGLIGLYFVSQYERLVTRWVRVDALSIPDIVVGVLFIIIALEVTRRTIGAPLLFVVVLFSGYALLGQNLSGILAHPPMSVLGLMDLTVFSLEGVLGPPTAVAATYVFVFILFGTFLQESGGGEFFFRFANALTGKTIGGPAKVAVISSALYGTISGSPTADVLTTGTMTIPAMKRTGYTAEFAAAVESVASTGGGLLPPVMGSAAFLMAEFAGIPYFEIAKAALLSAFLYYLSVYLQVHFHAVKKNLPRSDDLEKDSVVTILKSNVQYIIPLVILVWLMAKGVSPTMAALVATGCTIVASWVKQETRLGVRDILSIAQKSAQRTILVTNASAAAGLVIGGIMFTGLGGKLASAIISLTGGIPFLVLLISMVVTIVLGMGMPTPSVYVLAASLIAPAMMVVGFAKMTAHFFILYFAVLSAITPPIAVAAFAASSIADTNPIRVATQAVRLGLVAFIIPFTFVYQPALLMVGAGSEIIWAAFSAAIGVVALCAGIEGYLFKPIRKGERVLLILAGIGMIYPGVYSDLLGMIVAGLVLLRQVGLKKSIERTV